MSEPDDRNERYLQAPLDTRLVPVADGRPDPEGLGG